jgi:hypothetical protein
MKNRMFLVYLIIITGLLFACISNPPMSESNKLFAQETQLSLVIPMRFYTWVKVDNADRIMPDIKNGFLDFIYDGAGDYLLKTITHENKIVSVWGNQILIQDEKFRQFLFSPFVPAIYALENNKDPLDVAFEALKQIFADGFYDKYENELAQVIREGLLQYRIGGDAWAKYKTEHFIVADKTIKIM